MQQEDHPDHLDAARTLADLLRKEREVRKLSLTTFAKQLGISRPYLSRLERGEYDHPSFGILSCIAKSLGLRAADLGALTGYLMPEELPSIGPYLRARHPDWPDERIAEMVDFYEFIKRKYKS